jgi:hypothetical protein
MTRTPLLCLALAGCATTGSVTFYPLDELKALDPTEDRAELLAHASEVAPSKRTAEWRSLVERAAAATLAAATVTQERDAEDALRLTESLPARFPFLSKSSVFLAARADVGVRSLRWANRRDSWAWVRRVTDFAKQDAVTPHLAQRLATEVVLKDLVGSTAQGLMALALERDGAAACDSPAMLKVVLDLAADGAAFEEALATCWKQLEGPMTALPKSAESYTAKLKFCAAMKSRATEATVKAACAE